MITQSWMCSAVVLIKHHSGDTVKQVATQLFECRLKTHRILGTEENEKIRAVCKEEVKAKMFKRLATSNENYGIVGLKRWVVEVVSLRITPIFNEDENEQ